MAGCAGPGSPPTATTPPTTTSKQRGSGGSQPVHDTTSSSDLSRRNTEQPPTLARGAAPYMPLQLAIGHTQAAAAAAAAAATAPKGGSSTSAQQQRRRQQQQVEDAEVMDLMSALAQHPPAAAAASGQPDSDAAAAAAHVAAQAADAVSAAASSAAATCEVFDLEGDESLCVVCWERPCCMARTCTCACAGCALQRMTSATAAPCAGARGGQRGPGVMREMEDGCAVECTCVAMMQLLRPACRAGVCGRPGWTEVGTAWTWRDACDGGRVCGGLHTCGNDAVDATWLDRCGVAGAQHCSLDKCHVGQDCERAPLFANAV
jgi:hypothetical protein